MSSNLDEQPVVPRRRLRLRFSLLTLLLVMTAVCVAIGLFYRPPGCEAVAAFKVSARPTAWMGSSGEFHPQEFEIFRRSQIELIKNQWLLQAALREPGVAGLPILAGRKDPVAWLDQQVIAEFPQGGEILYIRLRGGRRDRADVQLLVDAVSKAYFNETEFREQTDRQVKIDIAQREVEELRKQVERRIADKHESSPEPVSSTVQANIQQMEYEAMVAQWQDAMKRLHALETAQSLPLRVQQLHSAMVRERPGFPLR
jgi:hypothetical protein